MKKIFLIISMILIVIFLSVLLFIKNDTKIQVKFDKCVDGDTAWFIRNNKSIKYRFLGIDTMELNTEFGKKTSEYVCNLIKNSNDIRIEYSNVGEIKDKYNRELVYVYIDGVLLQEKLISEGFAKIKYIYAKYEYIDNLVNIQNSAKLNKLGIWENYKETPLNKYHKIKLDIDGKKEEIKVLKDSIYIIDNPTKIGCKFIGWKNNNKLFDMTTKINKDYNLKAEFVC